MRKSVATVGADAAIAAVAAFGVPVADGEATPAIIDEAIAGKVTATAEPEVPEVINAGVPTVYCIRAIPAGGFCRAGRRWFREGEEVNRCDFSDAQWAALKGEPMLSVVAC